MNHFSTAKETLISHTATWNVNPRKIEAEFRAAVALHRLRYTYSMMSGSPFLPIPCQGALILQELHGYKDLSDTGAQCCSCGTGFHSTCDTGVHSISRVRSTCTIEMKQKCESEASRGECGRGCVQRRSSAHLNDQYFRHFFQQRPARVRPYSGTWMPHALPRTTTIFDFFWEQAHAKVGVSVQGKRECSSRVLQVGQEEEVSQWGDQQVGGQEEEPTGSSGPVQFLGCYRVYL